MSNILENIEKLSDVDLQFEFDNSLIVRDFCKLTQCWKEKRLRQLQADNKYFNREVVLILREYK